MGRSRPLAPVLAIIALVLAGVRADAVPTSTVIQTVGGPDVQPGWEIQMPIAPPGPGFTSASAESSDPSAVTVDQPNAAGGGLSVHCTVVSNDMQLGWGGAVVTVTWTNPTTKAVRKQFFVVDAGAGVGGSRAETARVGDNVWETQTGTAVTTFTCGGGRPVSGPDPRYPKTIVALRPGMGILVVRDKDTKRVTVVVLTVQAKDAAATIPAPTTPAPAAPRQPDKEGGGD